MMMSLLWRKRHISWKCLLWWKIAAMMKMKEKVMGMMEGVIMTAEDLMMTLLCMKVRLLKGEGKLRRETSQGTAIERHEVCHHFGSSRRIWLVQQMWERIKTLNQFKKLFRGSTRRNGNKR